MPMIGDIAQSFHATTTFGEINFPTDYYGKWVILFSYIADFTPVCTTEIMTFASMIKEFKDINTELIGLSCDSLYSHIAWIRKIKELAWKDMKRIEVAFPLIADNTKEVSNAYGMLRSGVGFNQLARSVYILDPEGKLRAELHYPNEIGRNIRELKRILLALQKSDSEEALIPAEWIPEEDVILRVPDTCSLAAGRIEKISENIYCLDWFISFKQSNYIPEDVEMIPEVNPYPSAFPLKREFNYRR